MGVQSKLVFLGTAGDVLVMGKQLRGSGGIILQYDEMQLHINPGPGALVRCKQFDISERETDVVLVSQNTTLHANDVTAVIDAMTNGGLDKKGVVVSTPAALEGNFSRSGIIQPFAQQYVERIIALKLGDKVALNNVEITPTPTDYTDDTNVGFLISTPKFLLSYVGDTRFSKKIAKAHEAADILVLNVPLLAPKGDEVGLTVDDAIKFIQEVRPILAIITGFGIKILESDILDQVRKIQHETKVQTIAAKDGLIINPLSFTATLKQRKLFSNTADSML